MFYNKFCYPHVIWAAFTSAITHAITPPPLDPHVSVTPTGCSIGLPPVPNGKKKKKKEPERCCHVYDIMRVVMNFILWSVDQRGRGLFRSLSFMGGFACATIRGHWRHTNATAFSLTSACWDQNKPWWDCSLAAVRVLSSDGVCYVLKAN